MGEEGRVSPSRGLLALSRPCLQRHVGYRQEIGARCTAGRLHGHALRYRHDVTCESCRIGLSSEVPFGLGSFETLPEIVLASRPAFAKLLFDRFRGVSARQRALHREASWRIARVRQRRGHGFQKVLDDSFCRRLRERFAMNGIM